MPPTPAAPAPEPSGTQSYSQALLARFSVPAARWSGGSANAGADFYNLLAGAVAAASSATGGLGGGTGALAGWESIIPSNLTSPSEKVTFLAAQRDRLNFIINALDSEARTVQQRGEAAGGHHAHANRASSMHYDGGVEDDGDEPTQRPPSGMSMGSGLSRNRSEADFETIDADSYASADDSPVRRRNAPARGSWVPWIWGGAGAPAAPPGDDDGAPGVSSGVEK